MINHRRYREWIISDDTLPTSCARELREHLEQCARCRALAEGWEAARRTIRSAGIEMPAAGFARRWRRMAKKRLLAPSPRQAWILLGVTGFGSLSLALGLAAGSIDKGSALTGDLTHAVTTALVAVSEWSKALEVAARVLQTVTRSAPPVLWLSAVVLLGLLAVGWMTFLYRFAKQGVD